jgi:hypothetical protein
MDQYIYTPKIQLDYEYLKSLALAKNNTRETNGMIGSVKADHHRSVNDDLYMTSIRNKLPFLSTRYNVYKTFEMRPIPLHIDSARNAAFNIPILNTEKSSTVFYELLEDPNFEHVPDRVYDLITSKVKEAFRFTLLTPTLINNSVPHMVVNRSMEPRIIISWSIAKEYSFAEAVELFKQFETSSILAE